jgi:hypothetical protein
MIEEVGKASIYAHTPVTKDVRQTYLDMLSAVYMKLSHSYKVQRSSTVSKALDTTP